MSDSRRPPAPHFSPALFIGALIASLLAHVLLLAGSGRLDWLKPWPATIHAPLVLNLQHAPPPKPPEVATPRYAPQDIAGGGNTAAPNRHQTTTRQAAQPLPAPAERAFSTPAEAAPPHRLTRAGHAPAVPQAATPREQPDNKAPDAAGLLEQARQLSGNLGDAAEQPRNDESGRSKAVYGVNAHGALWAGYVDDCVRKMERVGQYSQPDAALLEQAPRMPYVTVQINADGSLRDIRIARSSGSPALDAWTRDLVARTRFAPFPPQLARSASTLEFSHYWNYKFHPSE